MAKVTVYLLIVVWGIMVPLATWLYLRVDQNERALAISVRKTAELRQEVRKELEELRTAREAQKGSQ